MVTNVDEAGDGEPCRRWQPQVGVELTAILTDPDGAVRTGIDAEWKWAKSQETGRVAGPISTRPRCSTYTPAGRRLGYYLRATATYKDRERQ